VSFFFIDDAGGVSSVTFVNSASSTGSTITIPADAAAGDIAVLYDLAQMSSGLPTLVTPSGWTNRVNSTINTTRSAVATKVLVGGDPGLSITGMDGNSSDKKMIVVFRPDVPIVTVTASTFSSEVTNGDAALQTVSASGVSPPVIVLGGNGLANLGSASIPFSTASPAFDATVVAASNLTIGYKLYSSAPADHSIDIDDEGFNNSLWSGYLALS
jgi:hypothetical protein